MKFQEAWTQVSHDNILGENKSAFLAEMLLYTERLIDSKEDPLINVELGVYKGKTAKLIKLLSPNRPLHLYDTFRGIVLADDKEDKHKNGDFNDTGLSAVVNLVGIDNVAYFAGEFPSTFTMDINRSIAFCHVGFGTYVGTRAALNDVWPFIAIGGVLLFDGYKQEDYPGVEKAIDEWEILMKNSGIENISFVDSYNQLAIVKGKYP